MRVQMGKGEINEVTFIFRKSLKHSNFPPQNELRHKKKIMCSLVIES